jgi:hypothetical protein
MNERIKQLAEQAGYYLYDLTETHECKTVETDSTDEWITLEKFAELIVKEMLRTCEDHPAWTGRMISEQIKQHFGIEEPRGWICPKCSADRTKIACPLGFGAQVDGRCPMVVTAQGVQK